MFCENALKRDDGLAATVVHVAARAADVRVLSTETAHHAHHAASASHCGGRITVKAHERESGFEARELRDVDAFFERVERCLMTGFFIGDGGLILVEQARDLSIGRSGIAKTNLQSARGGRQFLARHEFIGDVSGQRVLLGFARHFGGFQLRLDVLRNKGFDLFGSKVLTAPAPPAAYRAVGGVVAFGGVVGIGLRAGDQR